MIDRIVSRITSNTPQSLGLEFPEAAVLIPVTNEDEPRIILTRRSEKMKTHGGQVAFPGGMMDKGDDTLMMTALRESEEEIGLDTSSVEIIGRLSQVLSRYRIKVSPFVGLVDPAAELIPCPDELHSLFKVPISFFLENKPDRIDHLGFEQYSLKVPCWYFEDYEIWGMSAIILMDFFQVVFDVNFGAYNVD